MPDILDINVWLALSSPNHVHHKSARAYWSGHAAAAESSFCWVTAMGLLRSLTNPAVMVEGVRDSAGAWNIFQRWRQQPGVGMVGEPAGLAEIMGGYAAQVDLRSGDWTDAYLAAFAVASGSRLVTFDRGFQRFAHLNWLLLK